MAKDIIKEAPTTPSATSDKTPNRDIALQLGTNVTVKVAEGIDLVNNETGHQFIQGEATVITVTVSTLRRLQDGDLTLV